MKSLFNTQQLLEDFRTYNHAVWPQQLIFVLLAGIIIFSLIWKAIVTAKIIPVTIALLWIWMGSAYHSLFFSTIDDAANIFGLLFILESILFLRYGLVASQDYELKRDVCGITAMALMAYSLLIYPLIGYWTGHANAYSATFGLPCPTTIFIYGVLLLSKQRIPFYMLIIPFTWAIVGFSAAMKLGIYEDSGLIISVVLLIALNSFKYKKADSFTHVSLSK